MLLEQARHQKLAQTRRPERRRGEAEPETERDEAWAARHETGRSGQATLLEQALGRENMIKAWIRVKANRGSAGVDGRTIDETAELLKEHWPQIKEALLNGTYRPDAVRRVGIPKPGGGVRELGIPTVTDRLIQQALLQILQPLIDPKFSEFSYGFRPNRRAHDAVRLAQHYVQIGYRMVVDVDLEKFFDRVNHDILMERLSRHIQDKAVLRLIRRYLVAGIMVGGITLERYEGTPQGGPLSPLLANVLLDEVDKELEKRGHRFVRYADDCNIYVRSRRAGERVLASLRRYYDRLCLKVNESKTAVASALKRKFLGFAFWCDKDKRIRRRVAQEAKEKFKRRTRMITRRSSGRSMEQIIEDLRRYLPGWKGYFGVAETPSLWKELDGWIRHRLRAFQLKQWKRGTTIYRELIRLGATPLVAKVVAASSQRWWHNSMYRVHHVLTIEYFNRLGVLCLS